MRTDPAAVSAVHTQCMGGGGDFGQWQRHGDGGPARMCQPFVRRAGNVASAVTLSATVLEGMRSMLAAIEQPNGSLAATLSGDVATILPAAAAAALAALAAAVVAAVAAPPAAAAATATAQGRAACAAGVLAAAAAWTLVVQVAGGAQGVFATAALATVGAALVGGMFQHQAQMLHASMRPDRNGGVDVESGAVESAPVQPPLTYIPEQRSRPAFATHGRPLLSLTAGECSSAPQ